MRNKSLLPWIYVEYGVRDRKIDVVTNNIVKEKNLFIIFKV